jgi:hypothetical protein
MGMDVYGKATTSPAGEYFRNSVWSWRPLATFLVTKGPQDVVQKCHYWQSNDGAGLGKKDSLALATWLREQLTNGAVATYAMDYQARIDALPDHECNYCQGTGTRSDAVGLANGMDKKLVEEDGPRKGQTGWCNACHGHGRVPDSDSHYPFDVENVENFCTFLESCGGFEIY